MSDTMRVRVKCQDGKVRHNQTFGSLDDAANWADWGHCCTRQHTAERLSVLNPGQWVTVAELADAQYTLVG